jgi:hypothetical protein
MCGTRAPGSVILPMTRRTVMGETDIRYIRM